MGGQLKVRGRAAADVRVGCWLVDEGRDFSDHGIFVLSRHVINQKVSATNIHFSEG